VRQRLEDFDSLGREVALPEFDRIEARRSGELREHGIGDERGRGLDLIALAGEDFLDLATPGDEGLRRHVDHDGSRQQWHERPAKYQTSLHGHKLNQRGATSPNVQARISFTTLPCTSVRRKARPWYV